jgi:hypothetical protein
MKNALIFVPLLAAHQVMNPMMVRQGILAFLLFGLCTSSVYILNDLLGLESGLFHRFDIIVVESGGRLYPAKDAHMSGEHFRSFYPAWEKVEASRDPALKSRFWKRVTS